MSEQALFVPNEMWLTAEWGVIESDGAGAWRTVENALPVDQLPAVRLRLVPADDQLADEIDRLQTVEAAAKALLEGEFRSRDHEDWIEFTERRVAALRTALGVTS